MHTTVYIAGPMTGYADHNYPRFAAKAAELRAAGWNVISPAELHPADPAVAWDWYLRRDLAELVKATHVVFLPGWERSRGARLEHQVAEALGMTIAYPGESYDYPGPTRLPVGEWDTWADVPAGIRVKNLAASGTASGGTHDEWEKDADNTARVWWGAGGYKYPASVTPEGPFVRSDTAGYTIPRTWDRIEDVPINIVVKDLTGDEIRYSSETAQWEVQRSDGNFYDWGQNNYSPFTEVAREPREWRRLKDVPFDVRVIDADGDEYVFQRGSWLWGWGLERANPDDWSDDFFAPYVEVIR